MNIDEQAQCVKQLEEQRLRRALQAAADFKAVAQSAEGRRFIRRLLAECGVHQCSFNNEPLSMAFKEGRRAVGLWVQGWFAQCPDLYIRLLQQSEVEEGE